MKQMGSFYKNKPSNPKQVYKDNFFFYFLSKYGKITETFYQKL